VRILGTLAVPGSISAVCWTIERIARSVLAYRVRCKEIDVLREEQRLSHGQQPLDVVCTRRRRVSRNHRTG
jgi:hypothetical protein